VLRTQSVTTTCSVLCFETTIAMVQLTLTQCRIRRFGIERCAPSELSALNYNPLPVVVKLCVRGTTLAASAAMTGKNWEVRACFEVAKSGVIHHPILIVIATPQATRVAIRRVSGAAARR
jgi:hypothetical protein